MANYNGNGGVIKAITTGGTPAAVGEVQSFSVSTACEAQDASALGDAWDKTEPGRKSWEGSLNAWYDPADAAQADLIEGEKVDVELVPESGNDLSGTAVVTGVEIGEVNRDGRIPVSISFKGDGALTRAAV